MTTQHAAAKTIRELRNNVCRKGMSGWTANNRVVQLCRLTADRTDGIYFSPPVAVSPLPRKVLYSKLTLEI